MSPSKQIFTIRATASRLDKGLLAIPQRFKDWFPREKSKIKVAFDDEPKLTVLTFHPHDPVVKENRIFGLGHWFSRRNVREGDAISITLEDPNQSVYRIALDRYLREREEQQVRQRLETAPTDSEADRELATLSRLTRRRPREQAAEELLRIARASVRRPRPRIAPATTQHYEGVPSAIRVLLREVHEGRCQLCSFTFQKRNGGPYFEIHHLEPDIGHHPSNLLVVCPNCHAQFEQARVTDYTWAGHWLVGVTINGKKQTVRQPLVHDPVRRSVLALGILIAVMRMGRSLYHWKG